ncbi:MAG: hypothetical protein AB7G93_04070 [Bdellovibrionales bacterium]
MRAAFVKAFEPVKLTFVEEKLGLDQLRKAMIGNWDTVYHCGGRPISAEELSRGGQFDGHYNPRITVLFDEEGVITRTEYPGVSEKTKARESGVVKQFSDGEAERQNYNVFQTDVNRYTTKFTLRKESKQPIPWAPEKTRIMRIIETGELVVVIKTEGLEDRCSSGEPIEMILVPSPLIS